MGTLTSLCRPLSSPAPQALRPRVRREATPTGEFWYNLSANTEGFPKLFFNRNQLLSISLFCAYIHTLAVDLEWSFLTLLYCFLIFTTTHWTQSPRATGSPILALFSWSIGTMFLTHNNSNNNNAPSNTTIYKNNYIPWPSAIYPRYSRLVQHLKINYFIKSTVERRKITWSYQ